MDLIKHWLSSYKDNPAIRLRANTFVGSAITISIYFVLITISDVTLSDSLSVSLTLLIPLTIPVITNIIEARSSLTDLNNISLLYRSIIILAIGLGFIGIGGFLLLGGIAGIFTILGIPTGIGGTIAFTGMSIICLSALSVATIEFGLIR